MSPLSCIKPSHGVGLNRCVRNVNGVDDIEYRIVSGFGVPTDVMVSNKNFQALPSSWNQNAKGRNDHDFRYFFVCYSYSQVRNLTLSQQGTALVGISQYGINNFSVLYELFSYLVLENINSELLRPSFCSTAPTWVRDGVGTACFIAKT